MEQVRKFTRDNDVVTTFTYNPETTTDLLPAGIYRLAFSMMTGFYLKYLQKSFELPEKIYGKNRTNADKVFNTYSSKPSSTGALFVGDKGNGKTLLSKMIANKALDAHIPVVIIDSAFEGQNIVPFLSSLGNTCLIFDEFEKVFDEDAQMSLLSLFDGIYSAKRLILLTANNEHRINNFLINRPGRILYKFTFGKVPDEVIREICADNNIPVPFIADLIEVVKRTFEFSIDSLNAIIEEYLRYQEPLFEILESLNIDISVHEWVPTVISASTTNPAYKINKVVKRDGSKSLRVYYGPAPKDGQTPDDLWEDDISMSEKDIKLQDGQKHTYQYSDFEVTVVWEYVSKFAFQYGAL